MCGLTGLWTGTAVPEEALAAQVDRMAATLRHRGPDDEGRWVDPVAGVALGFRRLAIIDLSPMGHQPMVSATGRYVLIYNGEVYNFAALREELIRLGAAFRGRSDTEVILAAFEQWGVAAAVPRFVGMFAMAVWDTRDRSLTLLRDRLGIKPLYYARCGDTLLFGSELRALRAHPRFDRTLDVESVAAFLRYLYIPGPWSIHTAARKLMPGTLLTIRDPRTPLPEPEPWWDLTEVARRGLADPFTGSDTAAVDELERLLREAVRLRLQADVPLGTFLSGGIDSTVVTALAQAESPRAVRTFSIAFQEPEYNEAHHAARIAAHLGTEHTEILLTARDALDLVPRMADVFDEPHADPSQLPAYLVCAAARRHVTVALSGDGGDEIFAGYNRYTWGQELLPRLQRVPGPGRRLAAAGIRTLPPAAWDAVLRAAAPVLPPRWRQRLPGEKLSKLGRAMTAASAADAYRTLVSVWPAPERLVPAAAGRPGLFETTLASDRPDDLFDRMLLADQRAYLPDDQLSKIDRVSMAVSLEARVPLLDHRVVEFSWRLGRSLKLREGRGKWALRQVLYRHVPSELVERDKMGLSVPIDRWLRGSLREWAEDLLRPQALERDGLLTAAPIRRAWARLLHGRSEASLGLWAVLMLQAWRQAVDA